MAHVNSSLYLSYGAYELKATCQRNLLLGLLITTSFILLLVVLGWVLSGDDPDMVPTDTAGKDRIETIKDWRKMPPIRRTGSAVGPIAPPPEVVISGRLNPVDEELFDDELVVLATRQERAAIVGGGGEPVSDGETEFGFATISDGLPGIRDFVAVERQPELIYSVRPKYPRMAELAELEGRVMVKALVSKEGDVLDAVVFVSSGHVLLDEAALAVAGQYKYRPAVQNCRPIALWVTYTVDFKLD